MMPRKEFALKAIRNIPGKGMPPKKPETLRLNES
jgi:hypothetical protein